jgi:diguanylate cyclase (GGDEF)-like protein/PAS domain S-box-containing protein
VFWQSPSVRTVFGVDDRYALGRPVKDLVHREDHPAFDRAVRRLLDGDGDGARPGTASVRVRVKDGAGAWCEVETTMANHLETPAIQGIVLHTRDITERSALEARLHEMAFTDALTELPNRRLFLDRLARARQRLAETGEIFTVLAVDLDGFKAVNDLHGHGAGDALLAAVSGRLRDAVRDVDTVARLGGDEFAVLVRGGADEGLGLGRRLVETVAAPYLLDTVTAHVSVSVGVAEAHRGDDAAVVLRNADLALRHAKQTGKKHAELYEPALHQGALERAAIEHDLAGALERGEIRLAFQPIFDLSRGIVVGAEALMRWRHGTRGDVSPGVFIPVAEESGQIVELGRWALHEACRQLAAWDAAGHKLQMGVNVSTRQLRGSTDGGWPLRDDVSAACAGSGISPDRLVLEITESAFLGSFDTALAELEALHALGVHIALDDFGTGYSSLSYLRRLPVDILKIDREFVSGMTSEDHVAALAELVVRLGERLGMEIVAEGVETAAEAAGVLGIGCVLGQGYHLGRPSSPADFDALLVAPASPVVTGTGTVVPGVTL